MSNMDDRLTDDGLRSGDGRPDIMSRMALIFGILAIVTILMGGSFFFGSLGIIFALLSRTDRMDQKAGIGFGLSLTSMTIFVLMILVSLQVLHAAGILGKTIDGIQRLDVTDSAAVAEFQDDLAKDLFDYYGVPYTDSTAVTSEDSGALSADPVLASAGEII